MLLFCWGCPSSSPPPASDPDPDKTSAAPEKKTGPSCSDIVSAWEAIQGYPYVWGGESVSEGGFDCSGAVYRVQKTIGRPVPRTTAKKYYLMAGGPETAWQEADCGDWVWWQFKPTRPYGHIGMHTRQPHAWQSGSSTGPTEINLFEGGYWDKRFKATKCPDIKK
ncbi:MAG: C40 family peptidase [Desulfobacteraceae bacterium]|nr:C40 family peptidase [Desulfobacteraceae bacterium]